MLQDKIDKSIDMLRRGERLAVSLNPAGYWVAFSGGKDSQALLELCKMAGVKYHAYYNVTSNDPPDNVYFIRERYPEVSFILPKVNFFRLVEIKGLPTIFRRFCCERLKEGQGAGYVVLTGVRREESARRAAYRDVAVLSRRKEHMGRDDYSIESLVAANHVCIKGKDKVMLRPLLDWSFSDVWDFIKLRGLPVNPCYAKFDRVGCMFCPFAKRSQIEFFEREYPGFRKLFVGSIQKYLDRRAVRLPDFHDSLTSAEEFYDWWKSGQKMEKYLASKRQLELHFDE